MQHFFELCGIVIAILMPLLVLFLINRKKRKRLSYELLNENLVLASKKRFSELKFFYHEKEVDDLILYVTKIINNGRVPISKEDFNSAIEFKFGDNSKILKVDINEKQPSNLEVEINFDGNIATMSPTLLNSMDYAVFAFLISDVEETSLIIQARIKGISKITRLSKKLSLLTKIYYVFNGICISSIIIIFLNIYKIISIPLIHIFTGSIIGFLTISFVLYVLHPRKD